MVKRNYAGKDFCLWDSELSGFGLRFRASGSKRWILRYVVRGRAHVWTIGNALKLSADAARLAAKEKLKEIALLGLPKPPKRAKAKLKVNSFADLVDTFLKDRPFAWKPSTETSNRKTIETLLLPEFGDIPVDMMRRQDVILWRDRMMDRTGTFNRAVSVFSAVMAYAEKLGLRDTGSNPCRAIPRFGRTPMQRFLEPSDYKRLEHRLADYKNHTFVAAIRLLVHTVARSGEISKLRWGEVSHARLELIDSKTGPKSILLSRQARAIIDGLPRGKGDAFVFANPMGKPLNLSYFWMAFRRSAGLPDVRLHDLRHSYASIAIQNGIDLEPIGRLLGHALPETTQRYAHLSDQCIIEAADIVGQSLCALMGWSDAGY